MSLTIYRNTRRNILGAAALTPLAVLAARRARAQEMVDPSSDLAQQLGYYEDASEVDASQYEVYEEGQNCANCQLYTAGPDAPQGPCAIFGNQIVPAEAWCSSWVARSG